MVNSTEVVNLEYYVNKSFEGKYFMGHTPILTLSGGANAWGGLSNPKHSGVNLYINVFTVSNYSSTPFRAELWLNFKPLKGHISSSVSPANLAIKPHPEPEAALIYNQNVGGRPDNRVSIFSRIAGINSTTVADYSGEIILPPGGTFISYLYSPGSKCIKTELAFGWWEERID
jgi:hypothetical protein